MKKEIIPIEKKQKSVNCSILCRDIVFVCRKKISSRSENCVAISSYMLQQRPGRT